MKAPKPLKGDDALLFSRLREQHILERVNPEQVEVEGGAMVVMCPDARHLADKIHDLQRTYRRAYILKHWGLFGRWIAGAYAPLRQFVEARIPAHLHVFTSHGGALCLSPRWQWDDPHDAGFLVRQIRDAIGMLGFRVIYLYAHLNCGAAGRRSLSMADVLDFLSEADDEVRKLFPELHVDCRVHVFREGGVRRTYRFSKVRWRKLRD
jgi:hypothetical protein